MRPLTADTTEAEFAQAVEEIKADPGRWPELHGLLDESLGLYHQRSAAATVRMRGWLLVAAGEIGVTLEALPFVLEELDNGRDAYLVAAAARALRSYPQPDEKFAPFLGRTINNIRLHDELVTLDSYGAYAGQEDQTTALNEIVKTAAWLGPMAVAILPQIRELGENRERVYPSDTAGMAKAALQSIQQPPTPCCCGGGGAGAAPAETGGFRRWAQPAPEGLAPIDDLVFEDHAGDRIRFAEFFRGQPTVVVFFYTRCNNPQRCSLTITKLGRLQKQLDPRARTAAITYDPAFDSARRMHEYARSRGVTLDAAHRILRTTETFDLLKKYFQLGVNFAESIVNRHRVELYVLDSNGQIFASFERVQWDERQVAKIVAELLDEDGKDSRPSGPRQKAGSVGNTFGVGIVSLATAFFPKCPVCWATFLGAFGFAGLKQIPYAPWLQPVCAVLLLTYVTNRWWRERATGMSLGLWCGMIGTLLILAPMVISLPPIVSLGGVLLSMIGTLPVRSLRELTLHGCCDQRLLASRTRAGG